MFIKHLLSGITTQNVACITYELKNIELLGHFQIS